MHLFDETKLQNGTLLTINKQKVCKQKKKPMSKKKFLFVLQNSEMVRESVVVVLYLDKPNYMIAYNL